MNYQHPVYNGQDELKRVIIQDQKKKRKKILTFKIVCLAFMELIGLLTLFFAVMTFTGYHDSFPTFDRPSYEYYGGDAYTGIQNSTVDSANNIAEMGDLLKNLIYDFSFTMGAILLIIGFLIVLFSTYQIVKTVLTPIIIRKEDIDSILMSLD